MNKKLFIAVTVEENARFYAYVVKVAANNNLLSVFSGISGIVSANVCDTLKSARETVAAWNDTFKGNGTYLFPCPLF